MARPLERRARAPPAPVLLLPAVLLLLLSLFSSLPPPCLAEEEAPSSSSSSGGNRQNYVDETTGLIKSFDPTQQFKVQFINKSKYRADVYWDDGKYGKNLATVEPSGGSTILNTYQDHAFFATRHGVREGLFDPATDVQHRFVASHPDQIFTLPEDAAPSTSKCLDRFSVCTEHAQRGYCSSSPGWMIVHCCRSCDAELDASRLIDPAVRCTRENLNLTEPAWKPGDLDRLFGGWATDSERFGKFGPHVLSSPGAEHGGQDGPWVMTFDTFMTDDEADALVRGGEISGFERSTDQGATNELGEMEKLVSQTRTSSNAWCNDRCESLPGVRSVSRKIQEVTGIGRENYESFQILEYQGGQFYRMHHDSSSGKDDTPSGHRIMTFFLYLTDVEEGGETHFTKLGLSVKPKKGRALVWPSVMNDDPSEWDPRMYHEAKDVIRGTKRAANHWIHLYDYVTPNKWGCTGSFS